MSPGLGLVVQFCRIGFGHPGSYARYPGGLPAVTTHTEELGSPGLGSYKTSPGRVLYM